MDTTVDDPLWWRVTIITISAALILVVVAVLAVVAVWLINYLVAPLPYLDPEPPPTSL